jgi:predicted dehydrogenase
VTSAEVTEVLEACRRSGTRLVVGTNHLFDPAWGRAKHHLDAAGVDIRSVTISVALPPNDRYHALVTELGAGASPPRRPPAQIDPAVAASIVRQLVTGLGIHDLPALRDLVPVIDAVGYARFVPPLGYLIGARGGDTLVTLSVAMLPSGADALWRMSIVTSTDRLEVEFPPAFVHGGSARARVTSADGRLTEYHPNADDGYVAEWRALADLLDGRGVTEFESIEEDARYVIDLAAAAEATVLAGAST